VQEKALTHPQRLAAPTEAAPPKLHRIVIEPPRGWIRINWRELYAYRDLFLLMVKRDVQVLYRQTVLGLSWAILRPFISMILFTFIFGRVAKVSSDGLPYPLFSYTALVPWTYFSTAVLASTMNLVANSSMLSKVYFPRLVFPLTPIASKFVDFAIAFAFIPIFMVYYRTPPTANIIFLPLLVLIMALASAGLGMLFSALAVQYRDINYASQFLMQILMYAAPVVWSTSALTERIGENMRLVYGLYPMVGVIEGFRSALLGASPMPWDLILMGAISSVLLFLAGAYYFRQMEARFADVV
jgi:lipopolysaccharide transport system permease protein